MSVYGAVLAHPFARSSVKSINRLIKECNPLLATDPKIITAQEGRPVPQGAALEFTGTEYGEGSMDSLGAVTISAWVFNSITGGSNILWAYGRTYYRLTLFGSSRLLRIGNDDTTVTLPSGEWVFLEVDFYSDAFGTEVRLNGGTVWTGNIQTDFNIGDSTFRIGADSTFVGLYQGKLLDFQITGDTTQHWDLRNNGKSAIGGDDLTLVNNPASVIDNTIPVDAANERGFTEGTGSNGAAIGEIILARADNPLIDVQGNVTQWPNSGYAHDWVRTQSNSITLDGITQSLLGASEEVIPDGGSFMACLNPIVVSAPTKFITSKLDGGSDSGVLVTSAGNLRLKDGDGTNVTFTNNPLVQGVMSIIIVSRDGDDFTITNNGALCGVMTLVNPNVSVSNIGRGTTTGLNCIIYEVSLTGVYHSTFAEENGDIVYNKVVGGDHFTKVNAPANTLQNEHHFNLDNGSSLYEHASLDPIRVPFGDDGNPLVITPQTGYTLTDHFPAIENGHNTAETLFNFNTADDGDMPPAIHLASPTLPETYAFGDPQTDNFRYRVLPDGKGVDRMLAFAGLPDSACTRALDRYGVKGIAVFPAVFPIEL